ncbi:hypothetical protein BGX28_009538 [Mortierella sp. GBA30]|nr:hypothetical protein BGX28_009538 [Mortierella sp. GBA30]
MLYTTVTPLRLKTRTWFILPFGRNTDQAHALHDDYSQYDQHDLFKCPHERDFDIGALDLVCSFDRSTMILGTAIGALAIIEVLFTFFYDFGGSSEGDYEYSHHMDIEQYKNHPAQGPQYESVPLNTQNKS